MSLLGTGGDLHFSHLPNLRCSKRTQIWRTNWREDELKRRLTVDPHSPGQFRAIGPHVNMEQFYQAFDIKPGDPMYRPKELRAKVW